jgi:hypothetical protein
MENLTEILRRFIEGKVAFSLIGGFASQVYGDTLFTQNLEVCARFTPENLRRIESAFKDFHPRHRLTANKLPLELTDELCSRLKNMYLTTDLGILDCLGEVAGVGDFDAVLRQSQIMRFPFGPCYMLKIDALMQSKLAVGRTHDLMALAQLKAIKEKNEQQKELF